MISFTRSNDGNYTLFFSSGHVITINSSDSERVQKFKECIQQDATEEEILNAIDKNKSILSYMNINNTDKDFEYAEGGHVYYKNRKIPHGICSKILAFVDEELPFTPLLNFVKNLYLNPSMSAVEQLFDFLDHKNMPITPDGCFLAYKAVKSNFKDKYSGKFDNSIGNTVSIERNTVDDNRNAACSHGLHVGTIEYVKGYGSGSDVVVIVKVNPKDVVSVPVDHDCQKLRCCEYKVVSLFEKPLDFTFYNDEQEDYDEDDDYEYENLTDGFY